MALRSYVQKLLSVMDFDFRIKYSRIFKHVLNYCSSSQLILGILASATGTAGGVAYVGLKGNNHVGWHKICNVYDKYCRHVGGSIGVGLVGSIVSVLLVWLSAFSLHSRVPQ